MSEFLVTYFPIGWLLEIVMPSTIVCRFDFWDSIKRAVSRKKRLQVSNAVFAIAMAVSIEHK
jgi:hypothetical protein